MNNQELKKEIDILKESIKHYKEILEVLRNDNSYLIEFYFIRYLLYLKKRRLKKLLEKLNFLEQNLNTHIRK